MSEIIYTDAQATDEAILLFMRKVHRLHPDAYRDVIMKLPPLARDHLEAAERRADDVRATDLTDGTTRTYPPVFDLIED